MSEPCGVARTFAFHASIHACASAALSPPFAACRDQDTRVSRLAMSTSDPTMCDLQRRGGGAGSASGAHRRARGRNLLRRGLVSGGNGSAAGGWVGGEAECKK